MGTEGKARENRARRAAERQGLRLVKGRRRDPNALGYGTVGLVDAKTGEQVAASTSDGYGMSLEVIERVLNMEV
jgi:hypothetical protein